MTRRLAAAALALVLAVAVAWVGADAYAARRIATQCLDTTALTPPPTGAQDVDYGPAHAWYTAPSAPGAPVVVMVHGFRGDRRDFPGFAADMQRLGYGLLRIDLACAHSHQRYGGGRREAGEIVAAVRFAAARAPGRAVVLFGFSAGGTAVLLAARDGAPVAAVVTDSAPSNLINLAKYLGLPRWFFHWTPRLYGVINGGHLVDLSQDLRGDRRLPTLIIQGKADTDVNPANGPRLGRLTGGQLWLVPGANHGQAYDRNPPAYVARVDGFFRAAWR